MNEKVTKKIGEAHAFASVLNTMFANNESVINELVGDAAGTILATTSEQASALESICTEAGTSDILLPKAERTAEKITKMGEMYVGDAWDDPAEVLEWMSFFVGGAVIHWQLIAGAGQKMEHAKLSQVATTGTEYYHDLLHRLKDSATKIGEERAG